MRFCCIADEDTVRGFRLAGIASQAAATPAEAAQALTQVAAQNDCGILILTEPVAEWIRPQVDRIRLEHDRPLIVEIPGPEGPSPRRRRLRDIVQEAVGIRVA